jgi:hypothetical protein
VLQLPWQEVIGMRLILKQPSPEWKTFSIEELTFFKVNITNQPVGIFNYEFICKSMFIRKS